MDEEVEMEMDLTKRHASTSSFDRGDLEATRAVLSPDYVYEETGTGQRVDGPDAAVEIFQAWRTAMPDLVGELLPVVVDDSVEVGNSIARYPYRCDAVAVRGTPTERTPQRRARRDVADLARREVGR